MGQRVKRGVVGLYNEPLKSPSYQDIGMVRMVFNVGISNTVGKKPFSELYIV